MKIPGHLKIGAHTYTVQRGIIHKFGETNKVKQTITLDSELTGSQLSVTLLHEILHAINNEFDHPLLDRLAEQLYQVLSDNRMLK
jgi:hypothetical protein